MNFNDWKPSTGDDMYNYRYVCSRPITFADLNGARWQYVEAPQRLADNMVGVPISRFEHGVIATDRFLLQSIQANAGLTPLKDIQAEPTSSLAR